MSAMVFGETSESMDKVIKLMLLLLLFFNIILGYNTMEDLRKWADRYVSDGIWVHPTNKVFRWEDWRDKESLDYFKEYLSYDWKNINKLVGMAGVNNIRVIVIKIINNDIDSIRELVDIVKESFGYNSTYWTILYPYRLYIVLKCEDLAVLPKNSKQIFFLYKGPFELPCSYSEAEFWNYSTDCYSVYFDRGAPKFSPPLVKNSSIINCIRKLGYKCLKSDIFSNICTLKEFISEHGEFKGIYNNNGYSLCEFNKYGTITKASISKCIKGITEQELLRDADYLKVGTLKSSNHHTIFDYTFDDEKGWEEVNLDNFHNRSILPTDSISFNSVLNYDICEQSFGNSFKCEIYQMGNRVILVNGNNHCFFDNVDYFYRVSYTLGKAVFLSPFYVIMKGMYAYIVNAKTLKYIYTSFKNIALIPFKFIEIRFLNVKELTSRTFNYICVDNVVYNDDFTAHTLLYKYSPYILLDTIGNCVAIQTEDRFLFFRIYKDGENLCSESVSYYVDSQGHIKLYKQGVDINWYKHVFYFDIHNKSFVYVPKDPYNHGDNFNIDDYDLLNDGLDGEADAYWNID